jgi:transposase
MQTKQLYPTDSTDILRNFIKEMLSASKPGGRPRMQQDVPSHECYFVFSGRRDPNARFGPMAPVAAHLRFRIAPVLVPRGQKGFQVLSRRWVVERTFSWFDANRRWSKDY